MRRHLRRLAFLSWSLLCLAPLQGCVHVDAPAPAPSDLRDSLVVFGSGEAHGDPDIVRMQLGVEARADNAKMAIEAANAKMAAVTSELKKLGVADKDLQTSEFNIHSEVFDPRLIEAEPPPAEAPGMLAPASRPMLAPASRPTPAPGAPPGPPGRPSTEPRIVYRVSNMLSVTLHDLTKVGEALSLAVDAGANQAWGISFDVEDPTPLADKARAEAVADAKRQAAELSRLAGVPLGPIVSITDDGAGGPPQPMPMAASYSYKTSEVPIQNGQLGVTRRVRLVYAIEPQTAK